MLVNLGNFQVQIYQKFKVRRLQNCQKWLFCTVWIHQNWISRKILLTALCSRNFQNVKLRLDFVEVWSFYWHTDFTWNQSWVYLNSPKNVIFGNFRDSEFWILVNLGLESCPNLLKSKFRTSKIVKNDIFGPFEFIKSTKIWFHVEL